MGNNPAETLHSLRFLLGVKHVRVQFDVRVRLMGASLQHIALTRLRLVRVSRLLEGVAVSLGVTLTSWSLDIRLLELVVTARRFGARASLLDLLAHSLKIIIRICLLF